jgi:hypothetical protein
MTWFVQSNGTAAEITKLLLILNSSVLHTVSHEQQNIAKNKEPLTVEENEKPGVVSCFLRK